jgi:Ca-activated chloride channel family protein
MFDFAYPYYLLILFGVPVVFLLYWLARQSKHSKLKRFGRPATLTHLMPDASIYKGGVKIALQLVAFAAIVIIIARPRMGETEKVESSKGIEVVVAFDLSRSMLASSTNDPHGTSRLSRAQRLLEKMVDRLDNDKVGLVIFAEDAKTKLPLTTDFYMAKLILNDLHPDSIANQGTNISDALKMASQNFSEDTDVKKSIILITDAEDHEGSAVEAAQVAKENGIQVNVVGVGTSTGAKIPYKGGYLTDKDGQEVMSKIDEKSAAEIAKAGGGIYINGAQSNALDKLTDELNKFDKTEFSKVNYKISAEQFPVFAWLAFVLLIIDILVLERKSPWLKNINFFTKSSKSNSNNPEK